MAGAVVTPEQDGFNLLGTIPSQRAQVTLDNSYPANGYVISGQNFGLASTGGPGAANNGLIGIILLAVNTAGTGYLFIYNETTGKLQVFWTGAAVSGKFAEVAPTTDLSAVIIRVMALAVGE